MAKVGFIGLGLMGAPMAANVVRSGHALTVYNRTAGKARALAALGAQVASTPADVARASEVVITMLTDVEGVRAVLDGPQGLLVGGRPGSVLIDMSTISPEQAKSNAGRIAADGWNMLDAPVFGSTGPAKDGTLGIMVGGDRQLFERYKDLLGCMGKHLFYMGPQGAGATTKLAFNLLVGAQLASLAESMALAAKGGIDVRTMGDVILASGVVSNLLQRKVGNITAGNFTPAFPLKHMKKDLGLMIEMGHASGTPLPVTAAVHQLFSTAQSRGHGEEDAIAIYCLLAELSGLGTSAPREEGVA
ncbi:MAG: NAD(P)-dependent oxidoreductase [Anaerolineales bacterium]|nr:NAD(P)-dependent oxidoreductase [Anaerolineales bacterium]